MKSRFRRSKIPPPRWEELASIAPTRTECYQTRSCTFNLEHHADEGSCNTTEPEVEKHAGLRNGTIFQIKSQPASNPATSNLEVRQDSSDRQELVTLPSKTIEREQSGGVG